MLRVRVVGTIALTFDGQPMPAPAGRPARALLGWLATHPGRHSRATVAAALWPDVRDDSARASLRTALSAVRDALGPAAATALVSDRQVVGLADAPDVVVDVREFERQLHAGDPAAALAEVQAGDVLADLDAEWILHERDRHRDGVGRAMAEIAAAARSDGDRALAITWLRRRAELDPYDESAHRELMSALSESGDRAGAIAVYQRLSERLRQELAVAPSAATRGLAASLRTPDEDVGADAARARGATVTLPPRLDRRRWRRPFVGRGEALTRLSAAWARVRDGGLELAVIAGDPGIGKSRLAAEFAAEVAATGAVVLSAAVEEDPLVPCQCIADALGELAAPAQAVGDAVVADDAAARLRLREQLARRLEEASGGRPLLLVLDDLHWADPETWTFLDGLARRGLAIPALTIATVRRGAGGSGRPASEALAAIARHAPVDHIELAGLSLSETTALIGVDAPDGALQPLDLEAVMARTRGNPFFLEALLDAGLPLDRATLPAGVAELVASRLTTLGTDVTEVLEMAAILGRGFDPALAARASTLPAPAAHDALDRAAQAHLVEPVRGRPGRMAFVHALVQEALISRLAPGRLAALHARTVEVLCPSIEAGSDAALAAAGRHAVAAMPLIAVERMAGLAERAAAALVGAHALDDAVELLRAAQDAAQDAGAPLRVMTPLRLALGEALRAADRDEEAGRAFALGLSAARRLGDGALLARAALGVVGPAVSIGGADHDRVATLHDALHALDGVTAAGDAEAALRARVQARLAVELAYDADSVPRQRLSADALASARPLPDPRALAEALGARHVVLWGPDDTRERLSIADEMLALARRAEDPALELQARTWRIVDLEELGEGPSVDAEIAAYAATAARSGLSMYAWYVPAWRAARAYLGGRPSQGRELQRLATRLGQAAGDANTQLASRVHFIVELADDRAGEVDIDWLAGKVRSSPAGWAYRAMLTWALAAAGREHEARRELAAQSPREWPRDTNWLSATRELSAAAVLLGDHGVGATMEELLSPLADRLVVSARALMCLGSVAGTLAALVAMRGDVSRAVALYEEAIAREERGGALIWAMHHRARLAETLIAAGRPEEAAAPLAAVDREAGAMGLGRLAELADGLGLDRLTRT
jgi:DNA-binding SARP family transcriptional activator